MKKKEITAIHEQDLEIILKKLSLLDDFNSKRLKCNFCKRIITKDNFGCIYPENNQIKFCCSDLVCYKKIIEKF